MIRTLAEKEFRQQVVDLARACMWLVYFTWRSIHSPAGFPDLVLVRDVRCLFRELKTEKGRTTDPQDEWLAALAAAGQDAKVWRPSDWPEIEATLTRRGPMTDSDRLLRRTDVEKMFRFSTATIYRLMRVGKFPRPVKVGARAVRWRQSDLDEFLDNCPRSTGGS